MDTKKYKALLVIDLQNDFLWESRNAKYSYDTGNLIKSVNSIIERHQNEGCDIIYIKQIVQKTWINRKIFGFAIQGTEGANLYTGLNIVSDYCFDKFLPSAFSSKKFKMFVKEKGYDTVAICGIDERSCVSATARDAVKNGLSVEMLVNGVATRFPERIEKIRKELKAKGVKYV